jgi:hypothetical protein
VTIEDLEENGLYKHLPELKDAQGYQSLFLRAAHLRSRIFQHPRVSFKEGLVACKALGGLFGEFVKSATVAFLTLYPRPDKDNCMLQIIADSTRNLGLPGEAVIKCSLTTIMVLTSKTYTKWFSSSIFSVTSQQKRRKRTRDVYPTVTFRLSWP